MKKLAIAALFGLATVCAAQTDNTFYAKGFPGSDVGTKVTNAQNACSSNVLVPCIIIIDPSLATWPAGTMPTPCTQCSIVDYRQGFPGGSTVNGAPVPASQTCLGSNSAKQLIPGTCTGPAGPTGPAGAAGVASLTQLAAVRLKLPSTPNLFDSSQVTTGNYVSATTGALVANASFTASGYIVANTGGSMATSASIGSGAAGYAFYDQGFTYISGSATTISAGGTITIPSTAAFLRISLANAAVAAEMVVNGTTLPTSFTQFAAPTSVSLTNNLIQTLSLAGAKLSQGSNLFNPSGTTVGAVKLSDGTIDTTQTSYYSSNYMAVVGNSFITANVTFPGGGSYGTAFYDVNFNFISALSTAQTTPTPIAVPGTAFYCRFYINKSTAAAGVIVVGGSSLPGSYVSYAYSFTPTAATSQLLQQYQNWSLGTGRNLLNPATATANSLIVQSTGAVSASTGNFASDYIPVLPGSTYTISVACTFSTTYGSAIYDAQQNYVAAGPACPWAAGATFTVPANGALFRLGFSTAQIGYQAVTLGSSIPPYFLTFGQSSSNSAPQLGKRLFYLGDSFSAIFANIYQNIVYTRTGMVNQFQDARGGRSTGQAFENYSGGVCTGTNLGSGAPFPNNGTSGNTLAQDLANVDAVLVELGTNDGAVPVGAPGDATTAGTEYGNIRNVIECLQAAKPGMRIFWVTPNQDTHYGQGYFANVVTAIKTTALIYSVPVLDMTQDSGINSFNWSVTLQSDGIHPSTLGFTNFYGPEVSNFLARHM